MRLKVKYLGKIPKGYIPNITNSATNTTLTIVEHKIPNGSNLVIKLTITQKIG